VLPREVRAMRGGSAPTVVVVCWFVLLAAPFISHAAVPPNTNDPCARSGRDTCGTAGVGFYRITRYGTRWFGDFRGAVPGHRRAFCIDLRFWYASPSYRYREVSSTVLHNRDGKMIGPKKQRKMAYALWAFGRSTRPSRQAATMMYVNSLMGAARPGEIDPDTMPTKVAAMYRTIAGSAGRYHGPYRIETSVPRSLTVNHRTRVTVSVRSATGHALPDTALSVSARGAKVPSRARTDARGRAAITIVPTAAHLELRVASRALASSRPRIFAPATTRAARNGQRLAVPTNERVSARVSRPVRPAVTTLVSTRIVKPGESVFDRIRIAGLGRRAASIEVELFGPFATSASIACTGRPYWRQRLAASDVREIRTPRASVTKAGFYVYHVRLVSPRSSAGVGAACRLESETTLATPQIVTGRGDPTAVASATSRGARAPRRLRIPALGINASIDPVGIDVEQGMLGMPTNIRHVGWWRDGMAPGARSGSILIAGHLNFATGKKGAFYPLPRARGDERVEVTTTNGTVHAYRVVSIRSYPKNALPPTLFDRRGPRRLVLVTCGGRFDKKSAHYLDNIVVTAVPI
jgi:Sortase domain